MTITMNDRTVLNDNELEQVNGATFTANLFSEAEYHRYNIKTNYHFIVKDEFQLPDGNGKWVNEDDANAYIRQVDPKFYQKRIDEIMNAIEHVY